MEKFDSLKNTVQKMGWGDYLNMPGVSNGANNLFTDSFEEEKLHWFYRHVPEGLMIRELEYIGICGQLDPDIKLITIESARKPAAKLTTLFHELGHWFAHWDSELNTYVFDRSIPENNAIAEVQAEWIAYLVADHFGIEDVYAPLYLNAHMSQLDIEFFGEFEQIAEASKQLILTTAWQIITWYESFIL